MTQAPFFHGVPTPLAESLLQVQWTENTGTSTATPHSLPGWRLHAGRGKLRVLGLSHLSTYL